MVAYNMKSLTTKISDIPESWIYKYYSKKAGKPINQPFDGRTIKIRSFTNRDTEPSLCIYYSENKNRYLWYDHSSGQGGDAVNFVEHSLSKTTGITISTIIKDYDKFIEEGNVVDEYDTELIKIDDTILLGTVRAFTLNDLDYWKKYKIYTTTLHEYDVQPLSSYRIIKNGSPNIFKNYSFGFYSTREGLYQIYQPEQKIKYLNTKKDYLIGREQLKFKYDTCVITSGLKDLMALDTLGLNIEKVAGKSENTLIKYDDIEFLKSKYKNIFTMLDNDEPGLKAMANYKKIYGIQSIHINLQQDLAKNNEKCEIPFLRNHYSLYLNKRINEY
jgi:hypothetical protein